MFSAMWRAGRAGWNGNGNGDDDDDIRNRDESLKIHGIREDIYVRNMRGVFGCGWFWGETYFTVV